MRLESAAQKSIRLARERQSREARQERFASAAAVNEVLDELQQVFAAIGQQVAEVSAAQPDLNLRFDAWDNRCLVAGDRASMSLSYRQERANSVRNAVLTVTYWHGRARKQLGGNIGAPRHDANWHFSPLLSDTDSWEWKARWDLEDGPSAFVVIGSDSEPESRRAFVESILERYFGKLFGG